MFRSNFMLILTAATVFSACNEHPVAALERVVTAVNRQENRLPAKTKIDFLFVIDDSGSMCEEQKNLRDEFNVFTTFLYQELGGAADYRLAVTSTDLVSDDGGQGRFLTGPTHSVRIDNCDDAQVSPQEQDALRERCQALRDRGDLTPVLRSDSINSEQELEERFSCMATLGTSGTGFEKGLEAMRLALSCNGPNRAAFGGCCVPDPNDPTMTGQVYNPSCVPELIGGEPDFLRPDALLVVIFVTDENDCSDPNSNPGASRRAICKYQIADQNNDGIPDGYNDPELCPSRNAEACYRLDCDTLPPEACREQRCEIKQNSNNNCEWYRANLTPVDDYFRFLASRKAQPLEQLVVATIVGQEAYTPSGSGIVFDFASMEQIPANCEPIPDQDGYPTNLDAIQTEECCPGGRCRGNVYPSCRSDNGVAFAGVRYLSLAQAFGANGIGCDVVDAATVTPEQVAACDGLATDQFCCLSGEESVACEPGSRPCPVVVPPGAVECGADGSCAVGFVCSDGRCAPAPAQCVDENGEPVGDGMVGICAGSCSGKCRPVPGSGEAGPPESPAQLACSQCVSICEDDFRAPLQAIKDKVAEVLATYCLDKRPRCTVSDMDGVRECSTPEEFSDEANYSIRVRRQCRLTVADGGRCERQEAPRILASNEWELELDRPECPGGALVRLVDPPPAGAEISVEFFVDVAGSRGQGAGADAGAPAEEAGAMEAGAGAEVGQ